jgi:hypothetical protein
MRSLALGTIAALAIGCSSTPTAPSMSYAQGPALVTQDIKPDHTPGTQKVIIYFYGMDFGRNVLVNMPVDLWSESVALRTLYTSRQHNISIDVPKTDTWVGYRIDGDHWPEICPTEGVLNLTSGGGSSWVMVSKCPVQ